MLISLLHRIHTIVAHIIAPPICASCTILLDDDMVLCAPCATKLMPVVSYNLAITRNYQVPVFAVCAYQGVVQKLIRAKQSQHIAATRSLGLLIWHKTAIANQQFDYIVPVPLHWRRYATRGYNQAVEIARVLGAQSGKPVLCCLVRSRHTRTQTELSADARTKNVRDAFEVKQSYKNIIRNKRILLVDDVLTTGSTMKECIRALRLERPLSIIGVVAARVT